MNNTIVASFYPNADESIVDVVLADSSEFYDLEPGRFYMECTTDCNDIVYIEYSNGYYILSTSEHGDLYMNHDIYEVLVRFTDIFEISRNYVRQIFEFAKQYR